MYISVDICWVFVAAEKREIVHVNAAVKRIDFKQKWRTILSTSSLLLSSSRVLNYCNSNVESKLSLILAFQSYDNFT